MSESGVESRVVEFTGNREVFFELLKMNPGVFVFKFGAEWCTPCKAIKKYIDNVSLVIPNNNTIFIYSVDVDECFDLYAFLKHKKMVNGIPVFLAYARGINEGPIASITGASLPDIETFFATCMSYRF